MEAHIAVHLKLDIPEDKKIPIEQLTYVITDQNIEKQVLEALLQALNDDIVEGFCNKKHQQGNGQAQYQRAGTTTRKIITMVGELNLRLSKVKDTDNNTTSIPFYQCITFDGKRMYQPDIAMATVDLAGKLSYRDVVKAVSLLIDIAPWRRALIYKYMYSEALLMSRSISIRTRSINLHCRGERDEPGR